MLILICNDKNKHNHVLLYLVLTLLFFVFCVYLTYFCESRRRHHCGCFFSCCGCHYIYFNTSSEYIIWWLWFWFLDTAIRQILVKYLWRQPTIEWALQIFTFYADKILVSINYALALCNLYVELCDFFFVYAKAVAELLLPYIFWIFYIALI